MYRNYFEEIAYIPRSKRLFDYKNEEVHMDVLPNKGFKAFLGRKMVELLRRWEVIKTNRYYKDIVEMERITINYNEIAEAIYQCEDSMDMVYGKQPDFIIIGMKEYDYLRREIEFQLPSLKWLDVNRHVVEFRDIRIVIVPKFRGVLPVSLHD
jgi:hypothetical protein